MKKRNWEGAIGDYKQLADLDQSNPNIYNELGDLYLKVNDKSDAIKSYERAVEAYTRVGLLNNAVAVCKKLLRFQSANSEIFAKLGGLRKKQGFLKEATTYYLAYMEKLITDVTLEPDAMKERVMAVADTMQDSADVLEAVAGYLLKWESRENAVQVLKKLLLLYEKSGKTERAGEVKTRLQELGIDESSLQSAKVTTGDENGWTEDKLWTKAPMTEGERIELDQDISQSSQALPQSESSKEPAPSKPVHDYGTIELERPSGESTDEPPERTITDPAAAEEPEQVQAEEAVEEEDAGAPDPGDTDEGTPGDQVWIPDEDVPDRLSRNNSDNGGKVVHVSQIIDEFRSEIKESVDEEDYRSHYDLGMAYLEMDFLKEAIQEFQFAAKSRAYCVRSLEMIGLSFLKQGQPQLAIKQLRKGLDLVGKSDRENLGLLYNLGLAYEQVGDSEKARSCFEDVYVIDVTFRDVTEKLQQYSS